MLRFVVPIVLSLATITKGYFQQQPFYSAASEAQIRFALENKYDDTGPGAKEPEYAYNTYKTLDEALIGYLDDPDTKLPEYERNRAIQKIVTTDYSGEYRPEYEKQEFKRYYPKTVEEYTGYMQNTQKPQNVEFPKFAKEAEIYKGYRLPQPQVVLTKLRTSAPKKYYQVPSQQYSKQLEREREVAEPYILQKIRQPVRASPVNVAQYSRDPDIQNIRDQYDPHPKYSFSYGVHVPDTGDTKSAHETREGGNVRGYYSFIDPDGKKRTVHYTADDRQGFRATVERTD